MQRRLRQLADRTNVARIRHHDPRCADDQTSTSERRTGTARLRVAHRLAAGLAASAVVAERAQDQPFPPGSPFALLPGFKIERVTPADKTESLIVVTFDSLGRPVVSQSSSGNGSSPRVLLDANGDGIFEGEKIVATS